MASGGRTKVMVADDHPLLRRAVRDVLAARSEFDFVGDAGTGAAALERACELRPDLIVMDLHLPDMSGIEATRNILSKMPAAKVVVFSTETARSFVDDALQAGARGYLSKNSSAEEMLDAFQMVMDGKLYLSPDVNAGILEDYRRTLSAGPEPSKPALSDRERQLLRLVAQGKRNKEIADELQISIKSVESYRSRVMKKLGCSSAAELVRYAIREGIASL